MVVKFLENFGLYLFIVSLLIISQLRWAQKFDYDDIDMRITICFIFSIIIFYAVMKVLVLKQVNSNNVSFALSFSILGIYSSSDIGLIITVAIVVIVYFIKKSRNNSLFEDFWGVNNYKIKFYSRKCPSDIAKALLFSSSLFFTGICAAIPPIAKAPLL